MDAANKYRAHRQRGFDRLNMYTSQKNVIARTPARKIFDPICPIFVATS
jgi:hypothetical protein